MDENRVSDMSGSEALTIDQASSLLNQPHEPEKKEEDQKAPEPEIEESADGVAEGEEAEQSQQEGEAEEAEQAEAVEASPVEAPHWWPAEKKALFEKAPPEIQAVVLEQEKNREAAVTRAQQAAAEARKRAETEATQMSQFNAALNELLPRAKKVFSSRWDQVDWKTWAETDPEAAFKGRLQMEEEQRQLQQLDAAKQIAAAEQYKKFVSEEEEKLKTLAPDLCHPETGKTLRAELGKFLIERGARPEELPNVDARLLSLAYDAFRWQQAQAKAKAQIASKPKPAQAPQKTVVKPTASAPLRSPKQIKAEEALARLSRSGSIDDAVAFLNAMET